MFGLALPQRRHDRTALDAAVQLSWTDRNGHETFANARLVDISESGMRVLMPEHLAEQTYVSFRAYQLNLQGTASVRRCRRQGTKYLVGLEFSGGLKWKPGNYKSI